MAPLTHWDQTSRRDLQIAVIQNSIIRYKPAGTDGLHNFGFPLHETNIKCCENGNLIHLAKEDYLCFNYCSDKYLLYSSVEIITIFHRYLTRDFTPANI